jgi:hypothetical protein
MIANSWERLELKPNTATLANHATMLDRPAVVAYNFVIGKGNLPGVNPVIRFSPFPVYAFVPRAIRLSDD